MPYDLKENFLDNFDCLKNHKFIYSDWAANLTIIVIGIWISNAMIFCNYGFWGEVQVRVLYTTMYDVCVVGWVYIEQLV